MAFAAEVLIDKEIGGIRFAAMISDSPITIGVLEKLNNRQRAASVLSVIQVFRNKESALQLLGGKGATDLDGRAVWHHKYLTDADKVAPDIGEVVQVGKDVLVRTFQEGRYSEAIVSGRNPLVCEESSEGCKIIWISVGRVPPHQEEIYDRPRVHLFVRTKLLPNLSQAQRLTSSLQKRFATKLLSVSFRTDEWFVEDSDYPVIYPFKAAAQPSDLEKVDVRAEVICVSRGADIRCGQ
jgi:hypothetical protein